MYGKTHTKEVKEKISKINIGNSYSAGRIMSCEQREQLSILASMRIGDKNPFYGKTHSDETKKKLSEARKGKKPTNIRKVIIGKIVYESCSEAARQLECCTATILHRIKSPSKKFKGYNYET